MIFYTHRFTTAHASACSCGPVILIRPEYRHDICLLHHERVYVRQWWRMLGLYSLLYAVSKAYRMAAEVEAYREQARHYHDDRLPLFAQFIACNYDLDITADSAPKLLRKP